MVNQRRLRRRQAQTPSKPRPRNASAPGSGQRLCLSRQHTGAAHLSCLEQRSAEFGSSWVVVPKVPPALYETPLLLLICAPVGTLTNDSYPHRAHDSTHGKHHACPIKQLSMNQTDELALNKRLRHRCKARRQIDLRIADDKLADSSSSSLLRRPRPAPMY